jgi:hypothetical protein
LTTRKKSGNTLLPSKDRAPESPRVVVIIAAEKAVAVEGDVTRCDTWAERVETDRSNRRGDGER